MRLPTPGARGLPDDATIVVPVPGGGLTVYRLLEASEPRLSDFECGWTRAQGQLRGIPELFRTSISAWLEQTQAARASRGVAHIARLALEPGPLTRVALTEDEDIGHVDVWAYPRELQRAVVEVVRVQAT